MKPNKLILNLFTLTAAAGLVAGCASTGNDRAASTANSLTKASVMVAKGNTLMDQTLADLNDLVSNPQPDLRKQFKAFSSSVDDLGSTAKDVSAQAEDMKSQGADYFKQWDKEAATLQNEDLRSRSEARKKEVAARFADISRQYDEAQNAFRPFMSELRDVQKLLSTDLTAGGVASIKEVAAKATKDAVPLKASLAKLSDEFKSLGVSMSPTTTAK